MSTMLGALLRGCTAAAVAAVLGAAASTAGAQPAPWYWWVSKLDSRQRVCAQHMPRQGWQRAEGPFKHPQCQAPQRTLIYQRPPSPSPTQQRPATQR